MQQLNERQQKILNFISKNKKVNNLQIVEFFDGKVSRFTVLRDLELLIESNLIKKEGKGRAVKYSLINDSKINRFFDSSQYFLKEVDRREIQVEFNKDIISNFSELFSKEEVCELSLINDQYLKRIKGRSVAFLKKEIERITIEFSWKSSKIEGNTYSLIDTELLIKERKEAVGHSKEEAIMILNHKNAIDYIFEHKKEFKKIDLYQIEKIHEILTRGLNVEKGIRREPVRITGTRFLPIEGKSEIIKMLNLSIDEINKLKDPFSKALSMILIISYIQPFMDGNKRTARILGNVIFLANDVCPLSYRSIDEADYKKGIILFYEQNSALFFKELFIEQFKFAVNNYF
jgi:Fic family protein